jgi:NADH-quinone oxidoreductase subunit I
MTPWPPTPEELHVVTAPEPGGAGGLYRAFGETLRGLKTTLGRVVEGPNTFQYP